MNRTQPELPPDPPPAGGALDRALALVEFLRARCPWDAAQTPESLQRYLLEEAGEVVDAIASDDAGALRDELGDLLLNLAFQVVIAEERGTFDREGVVAGLEEKMRRRHPHLYGLGDAEPWERLKERERGAPPRGVLDGVARGADPLLRALKLQERVAGVGFDWPDPDGALDKVREEAEEVRAALHDAGDPDAVEEEVGDLLFSAVNLARLAGASPVTALARANAKFVRRFRALEALAERRGVVVEEAGLAALDELWNEVKAAEKAAPVPTPTRPTR